MAGSAGAIEIVVGEEDHTFSLNEKALKSLLLHPKVKDHKVVVLSVAGAFRKGKSFLLDFFLRYLHAKGEEGWMGTDDEPLKGFPWKGGSERMTKGILLWDEPFEVELPTGEVVCVLLMDTQGAFDSQSTVKDCATVFALSTLISSVLVYNITNNIQEDDLQHLQLFAEYGRLAMEGSSSKPFQDLHFLVRDWPFAYEYDYGTKGGEQILESRLKVDNSQHKELQQLRTHIRSCFTNISCYLMPHPGLKVATNPDFNGRLSDIEEDFQIHVKAFVESLLRPDKLVVKKINGSPVTGKELVEYFKTYVRLFQSDELPEPKSVLEATAEANNLAAIANAKDLYTKEMEKVCGGDMPYLGEAMLEAEHKRCKEHAMELFHTTRKMGGATFSDDYAFRLGIELERLYDSYVKHNASKNILAGMQTPIVILAILLASYFISGVFGMIGLYSIANLSNLLIYVAIVALAVWAYTKFTGQYREVGGAIDSAAVYIHDTTLAFIRARQQDTTAVDHTKKDQ